MKKKTAKIVKLPTPAVLDQENVLDILNATLDEARHGEIESVCMVVGYKPDSVATRNGVVFVTRFGGYADKTATIGRLFQLMMDVREAQ